MRNLCLFLLAVIATPNLANGQVTQWHGVSVNFGTLLDFDSPAVPLGPIAEDSPVFVAAGIEKIIPTGTWTNQGDVVSPGVNVNGRLLVVSNGGLAVAQAGDPLDGPSFGSGLDIRLTDFVDEFGMNFADLFGIRYNIELFNDNTPIESSPLLLFAGSAPRPGVIWRGHAPFDRIVITFALSDRGFAFDEIGLGSGPPHVPNHCVETSFIGTRVVAVGGAVYFQLATGAPTTFEGLWTHYTAAAGTPVGLEVYTCNGSFSGRENNPAAWTLVAVDDGSTLAGGQTLPTKFSFANPLVLPAGTRGIAVVAIGSGHRYTRSQTSIGFFNQFCSADGNLTQINGSGTPAPFSGTVTTGRNWNGRLCPTGPLEIGTSYCMAAPNSTGNAGTLGATGSTLATANLVTLNGADLPLNEFGYFLASRTPDFVVGAGGVSDGNLCLGGSLGRLNMPNQILFTGASGTMSLEVDITMVPELGFPQTVMAGETWNFQGWHRDITTLGSNFTEGLAISFD